MHKLSIITIHYRCADVLQGLLDSAATLGPMKEAEWIVIDHSPEEPPLRERLTLPENFDSVRIIEYPQKKGFGEGCNIGAKNSDGQVLFFLNPDCRFQGGALLAYSDSLLANKKFSAVGPRLVNPQGLPEFSFSGFTGILSEARWRAERFLTSRLEVARNAINRRFTRPRAVDWTTGGALFVTREAFTRVGGFDEDFFLYFEDVDLCKRLHDAGYGVGFDPSMTLLHDHGKGGSTKVPGGKSTVYRQSQIRYYDKHKSPIERTLLRAYLKVSGKHPA